MHSAIKRQRTLIVAGWVIAATPGVLLALQLLHALHLRLYLHHWPIVYRDDPQSVLLGIHDGLVFAAFLAALCALPLWAALSVYASYRLPWIRRSIARQAALCLLGLAALALFYRFDPTGYVTWFMD